ncbi:MAG: baseplate J/gp47 family protein, partial [Bacteroidota bacterium]
MKREGTDQNSRFIESLNPGSVKLNDFSMEEWMRFAYRFAQHVNYFNTSDFENPAGDWVKFFISEEELKDFLSRVETGKTLNPHLALYVSFIKLLEFSKKRFNQLTKRHLDFYYKNILQIEKLPATPDKVHLIFELAKNVTSEKISEETELDGGKDADGVKRIYKTTQEFVANKSTVASLKSVYNTHSGKKLKAAEKANSFDGMGADFPENEIKWWPFGYYDDANYPGLPDAKIGFAFAAEVLEMQEGERNVFITAVFTTAPDAASAEILRNNLEIYCSGEKGWLGPFEVMPTFEEEEENEFTSELNPGQKKLKIAFQVPKDEEPVVPYNSEVLGENFKTSHPVCRILIKTENEAGFELYRNLAGNELENLNVEVDVRGVKSLLLESDIGKLNAEKPFYPFGTQPVKRSNFYIDCPELFKKRWTQLDVEIDWKNTPEKLEKSNRDAFVDLYFAYRKEHLAQTSPSTYSFGMLDIEEVRQTLRTKNIKDDKTSLQAQMNDFPWVKKPGNLIVNSNNYFTAKIDIRNKEEWDTIDGGNAKPLFSPKGDGFQTKFQVSNTSQIFEEDKNGPVRLSLNQSFLHELFPKIYALAFKSEEENVLIPNEPYTPMVEEISLDYKAAGSINLTLTEEGYATNKLTLFHEYPFGQSEEHPWLKEQLSFLKQVDRKTTLAPVYC